LVGEVTFRFLNKREAVAEGVGGIQDRVQSEKGLGVNGGEKRVKKGITDHNHCIWNAICKKRS